MIGFVGAVGGCGVAKRSSFVSGRQMVMPRARVALRMAVSVGDSIPLDIPVFIDGEEKKSKDVLEGKTVAICAIPGALTPTCSNKHVPSFIDKADELKQKGIDDIYVIAVNDPFVMKAFAEKLGGEGKVKMIADGNAEFTKAIGLTKDTGNFGGLRSHRYSMIATNGTVLKLNVDTEGYQNSSADKLLDQMGEAEDPLAAFCKDAPDADECRTYES
eukprot:CAMPEP_0198726340 /NCGR_PEP_ID=MMETSP1475-20131203/3400_1 /TAXON_ID= ORGANISM="Unidentified sp., Strain CCMP1999" /NCGR_SAMPLE_ID=MMETSP1475 /ASSEMBLY_ACC=CAM_ASM_001111 /LENGTH=215 /DNA_ID=CAMNT_0044488247 /DNA_START=74 /DNA_END=721 /DNA_ORIENTATION=-